MILSMLIQAQIYTHQHRLPFANIRACVETTLHSRPYNDTGSETQTDSAAPFVGQGHLGKDEESLLPCRLLQRWRGWFECSGGRWRQYNKVTGWLSRSGRFTRAATRQLCIAPGEGHSASSFTVARTSRCSWGPPSMIWRGEEYRSGNTRCLKSLAAECTMNAL
jgi:hypothetical protein